MVNKLDWHTYIATNYDYAAESEDMRERERETEKWIMKQKRNFDTFFVSLA